MNPREQQLLLELQRIYQNATGWTREMRPTDNLQEDLSIDSLIAVQMISNIEDHYGIELLERPELQRVQTVGDLVKLLDLQLQTPAAANS